MSLLAIRTIRIQNYSITRSKARDAGSNFIKIINSRYPNGVDSDKETYFVMPGYEHVTKYQPVATFNNSDNSWELSTINKFKRPNK